MKELDSKLASLKKYGLRNVLSKLNKRIYDLNLDDQYLASLDKEKIAYVHVKIHNALSFKKPFAPFDKLKTVHDRLSKFMKSHHHIDRLDD